jgi:hypothetical protein
VEIIVAGLVADEQEHQEAQSQAHGQAEEVDQGVELEAGHGAESDFHDVSEHIDSDGEG